MSRKSGYPGLDHIPSVHRSQDKAHASKAQRRRQQAKRDREANRFKEEKEREDRAAARKESAKREKELLELLNGAGLTKSVHGDRVLRVFNQFRYKGPNGFYAGTTKQIVVIL